MKFICSLIILSFISISSNGFQNNEIRGKIGSVHSGAQGLYFTVDSGLPNSCKGAPTSYLFISNNNLSGMMIATTSGNNAVTIYAEYDKTSLDCKVLTIKSIKLSVNK